MSEEPQPFDEDKITKLGVRVGDHHFKCALTDEELDAVSERVSEDEYVRETLDKMVNEVVIQWEKETDDRSA